MELHRNVAYTSRPAVYVPGLMEFICATSRPGFCFFLKVDTMSTAGPVRIWSRWLGICRLRRAYVPVEAGEPGQGQRVLDTQAWTAPPEIGHHPPQ